MLFVLPERLESLEQMGKVAAAELNYLKMG